ncbi:MAG: hypothetical protein IJ133_05770, partial [Clostridia bacterium]|nr:hypothetical protein [Clostridia bacterium]
GYEGTLWRLCDTHDYVNYLSGNVIENVSKNVMESTGMAMASTGTITRDGGYSWHLELNGPHSAHMSYINEQTWGDVDVCGIPDGFHVLTLDKSTCQFYRLDTNSNNTLDALYNGNTFLGGYKTNIVDLAQSLLQKI